MQDLEFKLKKSMYHVKDSRTPGNSLLTHDSLKKGHFDYRVAWGLELYTGGCPWVLSFKQSSKAPDLRVEISNQDVKSPNVSLSNKLTCKRGIKTTKRRLATYVKHSALDKI